MKANFSTLPPASMAGRVTSRNGRHGTKYILDKRLTDAERERLRNYSNLLLCTAYNSIFNFINKDAVIILDN